MKIHFLNVGNGDCTIIELPDNTIMMVDLRNARNDSSYNHDFENPIRYLRQLTSSQSIFRYAQTHPEMDHMDGLADLAANYSITNFWDTENKRKKPEEFSDEFREKDWDKYQELHKGNDTKFRYRSTSKIGLNNGEFNYNIYVLNPTEQSVSQGNEGEDWNLLSYIVLIEYQEFKLLLGGDASDDAWQNLYRWIVNNPDAKSLLSNITVFKASHHGRNSSYCGSELLDIMKPQKIVISKGSVPPDQSAYGKYYEYMRGAENLFLTSKGTVIAHYNDIENRKYLIKYKDQ